MAKTEKGRTAALKAWETRRAKRPKLVCGLPVIFPLRGEVVEMTITVDCEKQMIKFKAGGEKEVSINFWWVYESIGGKK